MPNLSALPATRPVIIAPQPTTATAAPGAAGFFGQLQAQLPTAPIPGQPSASNPVPLTPPTADVTPHATAQAPAGELQVSPRGRILRPADARALLASAPVAGPATPPQTTTTTTTAAPTATPPDPAGAAPPELANNTDPQPSADDPAAAAKSANAAAIMLPASLAGVSTDPARDSGRPRSKPGAPAPSTAPPTTHAQPQLDPGAPQPAAAAAPPASAAPPPPHAQSSAAADPAPATPSSQASAAQPASVELRRTKVATAETSETMPATPAEAAPLTAAPAPIATTPTQTHLAAAALLQSPAASQPPQPAAPAPPAVQVAQAIADPVRVVLAAPSQQSGGAHITTIQLDPVELGRVEIRIERTGDGPAKIELAAERPETLLRLMHDQPQLQQALDQAGIPQQGRTITFSLAPDSGAAGSSFANSTGDGSAGGNPQRSQQGYGNPNGTASDPTGSLVPIPVWSKTGLDITA